MVAAVPAVEDQLLLPHHPVRVRTCVYAGCLETVRKERKKRFVVNTARMRKKPMTAASWCGERETFILF